MNAIRVCHVKVTDDLDLSVLILNIFLFRILCVVLKPPFCYAQTVVGFLK